MKKNLHALAIDGKYDEMNEAFQSNRDELFLRIDAQTEDGELTALHYACRYGKTEVVKLLLREGANIFSKAVNGYTSLHEAAANSRLDVIDVLLQKDNSLLEMVDNNGNTPLLEACFQSRGLHAVQHLVALGASYACSNRDGDTPLHLAASESTATVSYLLDLGMDPSLTNSQGQTPVHSACSLQNADSAALLVQVWWRHFSASIPTSTSTSTSSVTASYPFSSSFNLLTAKSDRARLEKVERDCRLEFSLGPC